MERFEYTAAPENEGERLDKALAGVCGQLSRSALQELIEAGRVLRNGKPTGKKEKLKAGDVLQVEIPDAAPAEAVPQNIPLPIVYEDEHLLVVNKPKGMVVHPAPGNPDGTMVNALLYHCGSRLSSIGGVIRPGIVHRIDKDTSGLLMIAKNDMAHESLSAQLAAHSITRRYTALVYDNLVQDEGTVDAPIGRDPANRLRQAVTAQNSKRAVTHWRVLERFGRYTLIEARLETGRTHQIRVHMAYIKHPLVGDPVYGPKKQSLTQDGQMLHAGVLGFVHPRTGDYMEFTAPLPAYFTEILQKLRKGE